MGSEQVLDVPVRRHVLTSERPFPVVLDGIYDGISQPDIGALFATLAASTSYEEFAALVRHAQGSAGLMRFLRLDDDHVLALDPQARDQAVHPELERAAAKRMGATTYDIDSSHVPMLSHPDFVLDVIRAAAAGV